MKKNADMIEQFQKDDITLFHAINDFKNGNQKVATYIYQKTKKYTYGIIYNQVIKFKNQNIINGDVNFAVEDIMQEVYMEFFENISQFKNENEKSFYKWITVVSSRMALKYVDKNKKEVLQWEQTEEFETEREIENFEDSEENSDFIPEAVLENKEFRKLMMHFVKALPETQAQTILYHIYGGMKYQEIADLMGVSLITVKTRMRKAKDALHKMICEYEEKSETKLRGIVLLPLLGFFLRIQLQYVKIPMSLDFHVLGKIQGHLHPLRPASINKVNALASTVGKKTILSVVLSLTVIGGGLAVATQEEPLRATIEKELETQEDKRKEEEQDQNQQQQRHLLVWNGQEIDITDYVYEAQYYQIADGTYQGVYITTDDVLLKMGFERTFDTEGNPFYTLEDFCISYYMGTEMFGLGAMGQAEKFTYGVTFFEQDEKYYVDSRLALRMLAMDGIMEQVSYGEFTMRVGEEAREGEQSLTQIERTTMLVTEETDVLNSTEASAEILGKIAANSAVMKLGEAGEYDQIFYKGTIGYVKKNVESTADATVDIPEVEGTYILYHNDDPIDINEYVYQGDYYTDPIYGYMRKWLVNERIVATMGFSQTQVGENVVYYTKNVAGDEAEIVIYGTNSYTINGNPYNYELEVEVINGIKYVNPYHLLNNVIGMTSIMSGFGSGPTYLAVNKQVADNPLYGTPEEGYQRGDNYAGSRFQGLITYLQGEKAADSLVVNGDTLNYFDSIYVDCTHNDDDSWMYLRVAKWSTNATSSDDAENQKYYDLPGILQSIMSQICGLESSTRTDLYVLVSNLLYQYPTPADVPTQGIVSEDIPGLYVTLTQSSEGLEIRFFAE